MPKVIRTEYLDDFDGKPLPEDTEPIELTYDAITYRLYLSDVNEKKLSDFLSKYTDGAEEVHAGAGAGPGAGVSAAEQEVRAKGKTVTDVRAWATENNLAVPDRGRLKPDVWKKYLEAN